MSRTDSPREYNARILSSKPWKAALALAHDLRLEAAVAIARGLDRHPPVLGHQRLRRRAIARVVGAARWLVMGLIARWSVSSALSALSTSRRVRSANSPPGPTISSSVRAPASSSST